ncbi:hypothetical protein N9U76_01820 [Prochlorococcus sp. AH-736-L19]|nr:hypothetical protein [Prochlorococcus sp. AH-736-L19]MDA9704158.1 hypothetical protein [Prochlorococcus sp. AH-736-L19]
MKRLLLPLIALLFLPISSKAELDPNIHKLCLPATDYAGCIEFQTKNKKTKVIQNETSINEVVVGKWEYRDYEDKASGKTAFKASLLSENKINLSFPYSGSQNGTLSVRNHPRWGKNIFLKIEKGQILSIDGYSFDNKYFLVRFDDGDVKRWNYVGSSDQSSDIIFISNEKKFLKQLTTANKIYITINLYQDGQYTFVFDPKGLKKEFR